MKEKNKIIIAIIAVILIIIVVIGATYAYWQWTTSANQVTNIQLTVSGIDDLMGASLEGNGTIDVANLAPASCTNSSYAMKKEIVLSYYNQTNQAAEVKGSLTVSNWHQTHTGTPRLNNLHYALTTGTGAADSCTTGVIAGGASSSFVTSGVLIDNVTLANVNAKQGTEANPIPKTLYLWVWIDENDTHTNVGNVVSDPMQELTFTLTWSGSISNT